ncbi:hypothetical protein AVEN_185004-1 [Araneus ventricosus]|uniref:Uncharacterized protein n=1 Tax=Araneus ventricosus TaxID=182803 RepID=A0A4Y2BRU5_ARAVE|nr:hypothetical protein AVEN_185004-1 [Araneus ventricosus]
MLGIYYFYKFETIGSIESKRGRNIKPKTSNRENSLNARFAQKKDDVLCREIVKYLEIECVRSNSLTRVDKLYPNKKLMHLNTSQSKTWKCNWPLKKRIFRSFTILEQCFMVIKKQI